MMKKILLTVAFAVLTFTAIFQTNAFAEFQSSPCPIMHGKQTKEKFFAEYEGKKIYFCCKGCVKKFNKNPEKYLSNTTA